MIEPDQGSRLTVHLPRTYLPREALHSREVRNAPPAGAETVLLVDDEAPVRDLLRDVLADSGYSVLEAHDGHAAVTIAGSHPGPIHLVITDVVMPRMSGCEVAERISAERPGTKTLYMSGYADDALGSLGVLHRVTAFLQKPFSPETLLQKVRTMLDGA